MLVVGSIETDEIITQILAGMKDKDLQKKMWAEDEHHEDLQKVLASIRAHEAADFRQAASNTESGSFIVKMKCHKCGKLGHAKKNCKAGEEKVSSKCGFCGGPRKCKMKKCRAYNSKCNTCNQFGHYSNCCTDFTKSWARKTCDVTAVSQVEDDMVESNHIQLNNVSSKKVYRKTTNNAQGKMNNNKAIIHGSRRADVTSGDVDDSKVVHNKANREDVTNEDIDDTNVVRNEPQMAVSSSEDVHDGKVENNEATNNHVIRINHVAANQTAASVVWCPKVGKFVQKASKNYIPLKMEVETLHDVT